ncbi:MAG: Mrp/NBP35 family ATP-binding protein [Candidatus Thorarchaeota archaeon]
MCLSQQASQQKKLPIPPAIQKRMKSVKHSIVVMSGKGGVGKSTVAANLALAFAKAHPGKVGIIDVDIHGPDIPKILGLEDKAPIMTEGGESIPVTGPYGLKVLSMAFFLKVDTPVIWRGPMKMKAIEQFLGDFEWGELDVLIFDLPPGTGDEPLSLMQLIPKITGVIIVTTPQAVSLLDTGKALQMANQLGIPVLGVIENMSAFVCPSCRTVHKLFGEGGGEQLATKFGVPLLGELPLDPQIREKEDEGIAEAFEHFNSILEKLEKVMEK